MRATLGSVHFVVVCVAMLSNGLGLSFQFSLMTVILTRDHEFSEGGISYALMPAAFCQIFNHAILLPRLIKRLGAWRTAIAMPLLLSASFGVLAIRAVRRRLAVLFVISTVAYWSVSFAQGTQNYLATVVATVRTCARASSLL